MLRQEVSKKLNLGNVCPLAKGSAAARYRALQIGYRRTKNLLAVQLLREHSKLAATVRYLGMVGNIRANGNLKKAKK